MELTQTYKHKTTVPNAGNSFRKAVKMFVDKHADVFEALTRTGNPYGESIRSESNTVNTSGIMPEQQLDMLQHQLDELSQTITSLKGQAPVRRTSAQTNQKNHKTTEGIGINRFRALQAEF